MGLQEMEWGGIDWIIMNENRYKWRAVVNVVIYHRVP